MLFAAGSNAQAGWLFVIAAGFVGVLVAGLVLPGAALRGVGAIRDAPSFTAVGVPVSVELEINNRGRNRRGPLVGVDHFLGETRLLIKHLPAKSALTLAYEVTPPRRGVYESGKITLESGAPFGFARARRTLNVPAQTVVHPKWLNLTSFPLLEAASTPQETLHERPRRGSGMEFFGLREYRSGDSPRHIHWKSSARGAGLFVREYEEHLASRLTVIIDATESVGTEPLTTFEDSASIASSLVMYALDVGHPVQLFSDSVSGRKPFFEPGKIDALDWLSRIEADGRRGLERSVTDLLSDIYKRSTNVLIFPSTRRNAAQAPKAAAMLQEVSARVITVILSARTYGLKPPENALAVEEEKDLIARLQESRTYVYLVEQDKDLSECLREPLPV